RTRQRILVDALDDLCRDLAGIQRPRTLLGQLLERLGICGVLEDVPLLQRAPVGPREQRTYLRCRGKRKVRRQEPGETIGDLEALARRLNGGPEQLLPRQRS